MVNSAAIYVKTNCSRLPILATHSANCYVISSEEREKASKLASSQSVCAVRQYSARSAHQRERERDSEKEKEN